MKKEENTTKRYPWLFDSLPSHCYFIWQLEILLRALLLQSISLCHQTTTRLHVALNLPKCCWQGESRHYWGDSHRFDGPSAPGRGGVLPYMGYIGMCHCEGYGFQTVYSRIGYIRDGPLGNLWGGRSTKKNSRKGKLNEKKILHAN